MSTDILRLRKEQVIEETPKAGVGGILLGAIIGVGTLWLGVTAYRYASDVYERHINAAVEARAEALEGRMQNAKERNVYVAGLESRVQSQKQIIEEIAMMTGVAMKIECEGK